MSYLLSPQMRNGLLHVHQTNGIYTNGVKPGGPFDHRRKKRNHEQMEVRSTGMKYWEEGTPVEGTFFWECIEQVIKKKRLLPSDNNAYPMDTLIAQLREFHLGEYAKSVMLYIKQSGRDVVTKNTFFNFLDTFGRDLTVACPRMQYFVTKSWFFGAISKEEIESALQGEESGTFFVRISNSSPGLAISRVNSRGLIIHHHNIKFNHPTALSVSWEGQSYTDMEACLKQFPAKFVFPCKGSPFMDYASKMS